MCVWTYQVFNQNKSLGVAHTFNSPEIVVEDEEEQAALLPVLLANPTLFCFVFFFIASLLPFLLSR